MHFNEDQMARYSRQLILKDVGPAGQEKLLNGKVLVIGAGGLGSPVSLYLAAAGVGTIGIVDGDKVDMSNLQRQIVHFTSDVGRPKTESAAEKLFSLNPDVKLVQYRETAKADNLPGIIADRDYDFIIDCTDNFPAKFLINDACVLSGKPFSHGGVLGFEGQTLTWVPNETCYRCIFKEPPPEGSVPSCNEAGILGAIAGMLGTIQAAEALKYLTGTGELLLSRMLIFDAFKMDFRTVKFRRNEKCPICGSDPEITELKDC